MLKWALPIGINTKGTNIPRAGGSCVVTGGSRLVGHMMTTKASMVESYCLAELDLLRSKGGSLKFAWPVGKPFFRNLVYLKH